MNKITLDTFIQKYNLGGSINSVKWESNGDTLSTRFISPDKRDDIKDNSRISLFLGFFLFANL